MGISSIVMSITLAIATTVFAPLRADTAYSGKVVTVSPAKIAMVDSQSENRTFDVADDAKITLNGKPAKLTDIETGDVVKVTVKSRDGKEVAVTIEAKDTE